VKTPDLRIATAHIVADLYFGIPPVKKIYFTLEYNADFYVPETVFGNIFSGVLRALQHFTFLLL
jgi:hypothetical protein